MRKFFLPLVALFAAAAPVVAYAGNPDTGDNNKVMLAIIIIVAVIIVAALVLLLTRDRNK